MVETRTPLGMLADIIIHAALVVVTLCCVVPVWHVMMASLSDGRRMLEVEGALMLPAGIKPNFAGYRLVFSNMAILKGYANTLLYVAAGPMFGMALNITAGYALSRESRLRVPLTLVTLFTTMFSGGLVPSYMVIHSLGWVGTRWALMIPGCTNAFFILLMMNAFKGVPQSSVEAARIDGAGHARAMLKVMLPQCVNLTTVVILNSVVLQWNSWFPASIYVTSSRDKWPLQLWIRQMVADNETALQMSSPDYNRLLIQYAVIVAATLPILAAFPFFQKRFEKGLLLGGVKE
jgi:putative aldouronate transport system permease protein